MALELKNYEPAIMQGANIGVAVDLTDITDNNGNEVIEIDGVASAVNYLGVGNAVTGSDIILAARGDDTNVGVLIDGKGSGTITLNATGTGNIIATRTIAGAAGITSSSASVGIGYAAGAGGAVTQDTSKATAFTLSKISGQITTAADALAAATIVSATWTNTAVVATDVIVLTHVSGGTVGSYTLNAQSGAGSVTLNIRNNTAGALSEALVIGFVVIKGVTA